MAAGVLRRRCCSTPPPEARAGRDFLRERGFDSAAAETVRHRVRAARRRGAEPAPARARVHRGRDRHRRPVRAGQRGLYDRFRGPAGLADPRHHRRHRRLRRPAPVRRRPDRGEVPQHLRDPDLQEVAGALRPRRRQEGDLHRAPRRRRRGLHRRHGLPPGRRREARSPPAARRSASSTSRCCAASCATRPTGPGPGHLHLRRRRRRPEGRDEGLRRGPALGRPVVRRGRAPTAWTRASCASPRATPRCGPSSTTPCRCSSSPCAPRSAGSTSTPPRGGCRRMRAVGADHRLDPRHQPAPRVHPHRRGLARHRGRADGTEVKRAGRVRHDDSGRPSAAGPAGTDEVPRAGGPARPRALPGPTCATRSSSPSASCCRR